MRMAGWIRCSLLALVGFALSCLVAEGALRLFEAGPLWRAMPVVEASLYGPSAATGYTGRPGATGIWRTENRARITINSQGFRGPELRQPKPANETRVAVIGDSYVEALQVEQAETFVALAEAALNATGRNVRVVNLGLSGAGPAVQIERLAAVALPFSPDIVVMVISFSDFAAGNVGDDSAYPAYVLDAEGHVGIGHSYLQTRGYRFRTSAIGHATYWLIDHVRLFGMLNNRKNEGFVVAPAAAAPPASPEDSNACGAAVAWLQKNFPLAQGGAPLGWRLLDRFFSDFGRLTRESNSRGLLVLRRAGTLSHCHDADVLWSRVLAQTVMRGRQDGIAVVDSNPLLQAELGAGQRLTDLNGFGLRLGYGHLNHEGHKVWARFLADLLRPYIVNRPDRAR